MLIAVLFVRTVVTGQIDLHQLESFLNKLIFSYQILCFAFRAVFADIVFAEFRLGKMKQFKLVFVGNTENDMNTVFGDIDIFHIF